MDIDTLTSQLMNHLGAEQLEDALNVSREIVKLRPQEPHYYYNHAMMCIDLWQMQEAADALKLASDLLPNCPVIRRIRSGILLSLGQFREGAKEGEWRFNFPLPESPMPLAPMPIILEMAPRLRACYPQPFWDGKESLDGKTILVFNEAGFGDVIQNVRYLPLLKEKGPKKIILDIKKELYPILKDATDEVVSFEKSDRMEHFGTTFLKNNPRQVFKKLDLPPHDYVVSLHTLPYYFDPDLVNIPFNFPYITPEPRECEAANIIKACNAKLKVGIVWAGSEKNNNDDHRSLYKKHFAPLMQVPGIQLFSLQMGKMIRDWPDGKASTKKVNLLEGGEVIQDIDLAPYLRDFNDTALALQQLDALVTVDTSVGHLAGALNVPFWTILPDQRWIEWRWQLNWYASQRMVQQEYEGDFEGPLHCTATELMNLCSDKNSA